MYDEGTYATAMIIIITIKVVSSIILLYKILYAMERKFPELAAPGRSASRGNAQVGGRGTDNARRRQPHFPWNREVMNII